MSGRDKKALQYQRQLMLVDNDSVTVLNGR